ncbi:hypothetical protein [Virgibacillus senegalensis]|uniref:hypothetical protein n=1 Tax=Virgibacillus senegalensis TaxID=1499679 RepID=UPI00069FABC8|nr:hypothetical protein [Virgibacillus senegalensis]
MKVIMKFSDGNVIELPDASKASEFVDLVKKSRKHNRILKFENPSTGLHLKRNATEVVSVEVVF